MRRPENENNTNMTRVQAPTAFVKQVGCLGVGTGRNNDGELELLLLVDGTPYSVPFDSAIAFHLTMADQLSLVREDRERRR